MAKMVETHKNEKDEILWRKFQGENTALQFTKLAHELRPTLETAVTRLNQLEQFVARRLK